MSKKFAVTFQVYGVVTIPVDAETIDEAYDAAINLIPELPWNETSFTNADIIHIEESEESR